MTLPAFVEALLEADAYPHPCGSIECIETHISWVLLTGDYVYKLKKPVDLGFLDFSTLERRRYYCQEELRCNQRFAPELYLEVVPVRRAGARYSMGGDAGESEIVDYAVRMHQFPSEAQLDNYLRDGHLQPCELAEFAETMADVHERLPRSDPESRFGAPESVFEVVDANFRQLETASLAAPYQSLLPELERWTRASHEALAGVLRQRKLEGRVRECHGDLHLSNIVRLPQGIRAFDCIEFNETLRWIDVINDIAFLVMDCLVRERRDLAYAFLDRYLERSGDYQGARLLGYYLVYRSLVRAKVAALQAADLTEPDERERLSARLRRHIDYAGQRALTSAPALIITCGYSASGKSHLAGRLVAALGAVRIRSDVERKRLHGLAAGDRSGSDLDAGLYSPERTEAVYRHLADCAEAVLRGGERVIVDAAFLDPAQRRRFAELAGMWSAAFVILWADAPDAVLEARLAEREAARSDPSEATVAVLRRQLERGHGLDFEREPVLRIDTTAELDIEAIARRLRDQAV